VAVLMTDIPSAVTAAAANNYLTFKIPDPDFYDDR
jgi:hypothetical protein